MSAITTYFPKLRLAARISAVVGPIGLFASFLAIAAGLPLLGLIPLVFSTVTIIPIGMIGHAKPLDRPKERTIDWLPGKIASFLVFVWAICCTNFFDWFAHALDSHKLFDWRLITAAAIWTASGILSNLRQVNGITDEEIFRRLNGDPDGT